MEACTNCGSGLHKAEQCKDQLSKPIRERLMVFQIARRNHDRAPDSADADREYMGAIFELCSERAVGFARMSGNYKDVEITDLAQIACQSPILPWAAVDDPANQRRLEEMNKARDILFEKSKAIEDLTI